MFGSHPSRWFIFLVFGALSTLGCVGTTDTGPQGETGSLSVDLVLADGVEIDEVTWQIAGNGMDMSGDIDVSAPGSTASVEVFGLPPGDEDYTVTLTATSTDEAVTCQGSAPFNVEIGESTEVMVVLNCKKPRTLGGVRVNGQFNVCTQLTKMVVSPLQTSVGNDISLSAQAFDEEGDPITYVWSGDGGSIADPSAPNATYTCQEVGEHSVTILVTDNDVYCRMATWTVPVTCVEGDGGDLCEGEDCGDGNECTDNDCDPASGECVNDPIREGDDCNEGQGMCMNGDCVDKDLCMNKDCGDGNECTDDLCDPETGDCSNPALDDGTDCNGGAGMCVNSVCVGEDKCADVTCPPTGNECTVAMCNAETGDCDTMNVPNGTECDGGAGACSVGVCVDNNLCEGQDCTSANDCIQDGTCDPGTGNCILGDNEPADTACNGDSGDVCDGAGNCNECNNAGQCPDDGNACTAAACESNACIQNNVVNGAMCDFMGGDGMCVDGVCGAADECNDPSQCDDQNDCTSNDCVGGSCEFAPTDGATCEVEAGVPGTCNGSVCTGLCDGQDCTSTLQCVQDGTCDVQTGDCVPGDNQPADTVCTENAGSVCDDAGTCVECNNSAQCPSGQTCNNGACASVLPPAQTVVTANSCGLPQAVSKIMVPFPAEIAVTPTTAAAGGAGFDATVDTQVVLDQAFLSGAASTLFEGFGLFLTAVNLTASQVQVGSLAGCAIATGTCQGGADNGLACTTNADCAQVANGPISNCMTGGVIALDTGGLPRVELIPNAPWPCPSGPGAAGDAECAATNSLASGTCVAGNTCDPTTVPTNVTGGVVLNSYATVGFSCTAAASGTLSVCTTGIRKASVGPGDPATETFVKVDVGSLTNVGFDCEPGTPSNPADCPVDGPDPVNCTTTPNFCFGGTCTSPAAQTLGYDSTGTICSPGDANAGVACTTSADCDSSCDTGTSLCGDGTTACTADADCTGTGGGTCAQSCAQFDIL